MSDRIKISLMIDRVPSRQETQRAVSRKKSIEEEVRNAICMCDSDEDSGAHWEFLLKVFNALMKKKRLNKRQMNLLNMIEPYIKKHQSANPSNIDYDIEKSLKAGSFFKI